MRSLGLAAVLLTALLPVACGESSNQPPMSDPSLYEPKIVREKDAGKPAAPRTLAPVVVSGVALAPTELYDGKLRILLPQTFRRLPAATVAERFKTGAKPDAMFQSPDESMFIVVALLPTPLLPAKVADAFPAAKRALAATYPDCPTRIETLVEVDGRNWMRFDLDGDKRAMIAMTSLDGRQLRIEAIFLKKPEQKWVDVVRKMWETAVVSDAKG